MLTARVRTHARVRAPALQLYIRASNRLVGDYVMTQNNIANPRNKSDSIGVGDWSFDQHMTGKYAVPVGGGKYEVQLEGNFWPTIDAAAHPSVNVGSSNWCAGHRLQDIRCTAVALLHSNDGDNAFLVVCLLHRYDVPYKIMLPKKGTGANLLVPVALSTSSVAFSSTRIENMYVLCSSS